MNSFLRKKLLYLSLLLGGMILSTGTIHAQAFNFGAGPQVQCYNPVPNSNTAAAAVTATQPGATSYTWVVSAPTTTCGTPVNSLVVPASLPSGTAVTYTFNCCGIYTISCYPYVNGTTPVGSPVSQTVNVVCPTPNTGVITFSPVSGNTVNPSVCLNSAVNFTATSAQNYTWVASPGGTVGTGSLLTHTPLVNTCYTVFATTSQGCSLQATQCVSVTAATISAAPSTQSMCLGNNVCFTAQVGALNNSSYTPGTFTSSVQWYAPNGNPINPPGLTTCTTAASGNYTAIVTYSGTAGTCTAEAQSAVVITTSIPVSISPASPSVCPGQNITLSASSIQTAVASYTWHATPFTSTVGNPRTVAPTTQTTYTVDVLYGTCPGSATVTVFMKSLTPTLTLASLSVCPNQSLSMSATGGITYTFVKTPNGGGQVNINAQKTSASTATDIPSSANFPVQYCVNAYSLGCTGTVCATVQQRTLNPVITALTPSICPNTNITFSLTGGATTRFRIYYIQGSAYIATLVATPNTISIPAPGPPGTISFSVVADSAGCTGDGNFVNVDLFTMQPKLIPSSASVCPGTSFTMTANSGAGTDYTFTIPSQTTSLPPSTLSTGSTNSIVGTTSLQVTTYTVQTDSLGCTGIGTGSVGILNLANTVTLTPSSPSMCPGTQFTLTAKGATNYTLTAPTGTTISSTNPFVHAPANLPATYIVQSDSSSCVGSSTITMQALVLHPSIGLAAGAPGTVCAGMPTTLALGGVGYGSTTNFTVITLNPPPPATIGVTQSSLMTVYPTTPTIYYVVADSAGCQGQFPYPGVNVYLYPGLSLTTAATSPSVCSGTTVGLSVAGPTNALYTWYEPSSSGSVVISTNTSVITSPTINTIYTVTAIDPLGCVGQGTVLVGIDPLAHLSLTLTGSTGTICSINNIPQNDTLFVKGAVSYSWAPMTNLIQFVGNAHDTAIFSPPVTTIYTVTGSNNKGCFGTANFTVNVVSPPQPVVSPANPVLCPGYNTTLSAYGANTFTWYGSTSYTAGVAQQSIAAGPGTYTLISSNGGTCIHPGTVVTVGLMPSNNIPKVLVTQSSQTTCIESNNPKFSKPVVLTASNYQNYVWFPYNPCCMTYSLGAKTTVRPPATTNYTVFGYSSTCSNSVVVTVKVEPQFTMNVTPPLPAMCVDDTLKLSINSPGKGAIGPASAFTYSWTEAQNAPRISINSEFTPTVLIWPKNTTTYTVEMFDSRGCASLPRLVTVTVLPRPQTAVAIPTINNVPTNTVCFVGLFPGPTDNIINLTAVNQNLTLPFGIIPTYTWTSPNNSILTPINNPFVTVNAPNRTPEVVTYTVSSGYNGVPGCKRYDTVSVRVIDCRPVYKVAFSTTDNVDTVCALTCITFVNNTDTMAGGPQKLNWTFEGGTPRTSTLQVPTVCYNLPGSWSVILKVENPYPREKADGSAPGSTVTAGKLNVIHVTNVPNVTITKPGQQRGDTTIRFGQTVYMEASGASWYEWSPSYNISSLNSKSVTVRPFRTTQYIVTGYNSSSCFSADTMNVIIIDDCGEMFVPTAFSPNGDGHNDVLKVNGICLQTMTFMIFNRWGEKVFETTDQTIGWDGTFRGVDLNSGVFVYRLEGKTFDGKGFTAKGNITLIR